VREQQALANLAVARAKTSLYVGDLYEAWALYQFAELVFEVIQSQIEKQAPPRGTDWKDEMVVTHERLVQSNHATKSLAWLGIMTFIAVCVGETGWSLWLLTFNNSGTPEDVEKYEGSMSQFTLAGFIASGAAVYNVYMVEHTFADSYLNDFRAFTKFLTVKILVSMAFLQRGFFNGLQVLDKYLPEFLMKIIGNIPFFKELVEFTPPKFELFYSALIVFECSLICLAHLWAWNSEEAWYEELGTTPDDRIADLEESKSFAAGAGRTRYSSTA
jgi:hypothetical protein